MPTALTDLRNRLAANRRRAVSLVFLAALHLAALHLALVRGRADGARGLPSRLGRAQLFLARLAAPPADLGGALAGVHRYSDRVVAVQAQHADDDGERRRSDAHRLRHVPILR